MASFFGAAASVSYDARTSKLKAISDNMHFLINLVLTDLPDRARILCVGAGTGAEIFPLAQAHPEWTFVAVDPSPDMIKVCEQRLTDAGLIDRCTLITGYVHDAPKEKFDAVLSILVGHFIKREDRTDYVRQMYDRLCEGGYMVNTEISCDLDANNASLMIKNWTEVQVLLGQPRESMANLPNQLRDILSVLPPADVEAIFREAGFETPVRFFQSFMMMGWWAQK